MLQIPSRSCHILEKIKANFDKKSFLGYHEPDSPLGQITYSVHYYTTTGIDPRIKPAVLQSTQD